MMVMTYSASVLVNVEGGEHEGNAFFHLVQLRNGFSSCYNAPEWLLKLLQWDLWAFHCIC